MASNSDNSPASAMAKRAARRKKKSSLRSRWLVLALVCAVMTGSYYTYDIPAALHQQLQDYMPPSPNYETHFNLLYTVYSVPNIILPFFGGSFVDCHGAPLLFTMFALTVCAGASLLAVGVAYRSWEVMYLGRFVFGTGMESLCVAQSTILSDWFEGREVALAMGIRRAVSVLGKVWNNVMSPKVANNASAGGIQSAFWIGAVLTCFSVVAAGVILLVDRRATKKLEERDGGDIEWYSSTGAESFPSLTEALLEYEEASTEYGGENGAVDGDEVPEEKPKSGKPKVHIADVRKFTPLFWLLTLSNLVVYGCVLPFNNVASGILLERNFFTSSPDNCVLEHPDQCTAGYLQQGTNRAFQADGDFCPVAPSQAPMLPSSVDHAASESNMSGEWHEASYVHLSLTDKNVDCGDSFWLDGCTSDYCSKQNAATEHSGRIMSIPFLVSALTSPLLGHLVDRIGRRAQIAVLSCSLLFGVHLTLALSAASPIMPLVGQGVAYSLFAAVLWPSVGLTVPKQFTGTAFGVMTSIQNIGLATFPLVIAAIYNASGRRYLPNVEFFFMGCAATGVVIGALMNLLDRRHGNKLNKVSMDTEEDTDRITNKNGHRKAGEDEESYPSPLIPSEEGVIS